MIKAEKLERNARIVLMHNAGVKHQSIAAKFNIDSSSVGRILRAAGIPKASSWITQRIRLKAQRSQPNVRL